MNRTTTFLTAAAVLLITALVMGLPRSSAPTPVPTPAPAPPQPVPAPVPAVPQAAAGSLSMNGRLSHPFLAPGTSDVFATLEVDAVKVPGSERAPVNLAVVIDRSGSMSGAKIDNARRAALKLVELLNEHDRLAIVNYGTDVRVMPGSFATPENKERMRRAIANIRDEGGTNIGDGLAAGRAQLELARSDFRVNRLLLLSDGQPTVGLTSAQGLANLVASIRKSGITVTSLGVGSDFNEDLMQRLADVGGGSYGFISNASTTAELFERDLKQAGTMVARNVSLSVALPAGVRFVEVYGRPVASADANHVTISLPDFSAEQNEKVVLHLSVTPAVASGTLDMGGYQLAYDDLLSSHAAEARVSLAAALTNDRSLVLTGRDKTAVVAATKAQAAMNYRQAADAIDRGDYDRARVVMNKNDALLEDAEAVAGKDAVADERSANTMMFGLSSTAAKAPAPARQEAVKAMKVQSLRSSGRGASAY